MTTKKKPEELRSYRWFGPDTMRAFGHRSRMMQLGYRREDFTGKPVDAAVEWVKSVGADIVVKEDRAAVGVPGTVTKQSPTTT